MPAQARADPARNTNCAEGSPLLLLPHSFPSFEALIVQYYNLKTFIIYFVLKRKMQLSPPPPPLFSKAVRSLSEAYCSVYTGEGERRGEARVSTMPGQSRDPTPLRKILPLLRRGRFGRNFTPFPWPAGSSHPGPAALSAVCFVPGPGIFIVAKGNEVGVGEEGLGQGPERWGWGGPGHILWQGSCNHV